MRFLGFLEEKIVYYCLDDPVWIRTKDRQIRNLLLYPTELRDLLWKAGAKIRVFGSFDNKLFKNCISVGKLSIFVTATHLLLFIIIRYRCSLILKKLQMRFKAFSAKSPL